MTGHTLLEVARRRFGIAVDPDSDGGQILNSLTPRPPFDDQALAGRADVAPLTFTPTASGVSVRAAQGTDALVFRLPAGPLDFTLVPPHGAVAPQVELKLLPFSLPLPFLHPAQADPDGTLRLAAGQVELRFPDLLLVVRVTASTPASARLAPSHTASGGLEVTMAPPLAFVDPDGVVGVGFDRAVLELDGPEAPLIRVPDVEVFLTPPGIPALAMHGGGHALRLGLGVGVGLSGDCRLALADGAQAPARPRFLHAMAARLRLDRSAVTLLELSGEIDLGSELSARLGPLDDPSGRIDYRLALALDDGWMASLSLRAVGGRDFLWRTRRATPDADEHDLVRDTLGAYAVFAPLLAPHLPGAGSSGFVDLALGAGAAGGLAASESVRTQSVTLHGGDLVVRQPAGGRHEAFLFFDLETELHVSLGLLKTRRPIKVRHRAIGLRLDFGAGGEPQLHPVFDPARGFSFDLSDPGLFAVPPPLGDIVQPDGARMARDNPLAFEVDLAITADLGVVSVDRASVRIPLDPPGPPTLTALGAHVDVPGVLAGSGYLELLPDGGFAGSLDAAIAPPFGVRVAAGLALRDADDDPERSFPAVQVTLGVELPVPIPLASSGLGLFGLLGLFAMHFQRDQSASSTALGWFVKRADGDATRLAAWKPARHQWGFGLGAVIGTVEGGFLFHAKGMVVIELPGPHLLLVMNADILTRRPPTRGTKTGQFLAVIELRPEAFRIGIVVDYSIRPLLELRVPVEAVFDRRRPDDWRLDLGGIPPGRVPASVKFLSGLRAEGYLLLHGDGIPDFPLRPLHGFSVAAGIRASFTWGPEAIGLYLRIAAQADLGISFKPFLIAGRMRLSGELHLFVVSVEASASATIIVTPGGDGFHVFISAEVCGSVDLFLFEVEGCVKLELGDPPDELPAPEPLVRALSLHSRSPALLPGSGVDRPVDGSLGEAAHFDFAGNRWEGDAPVVPIDAIPVLQLEMRPHVDPACRFLGRAIGSKLAPNGWLRRGERFYRYTLRSVELASENAGGTPLVPAVGDGETPTTWWDRHGAAGGGDDNDVQLALLSWIPDPTPAAAEHNVHLDQRVRRRWGETCAKVAPPARVLWTFRDALLGPASAGWTVQGVPNPDPPGIRRSLPPGRTLRVIEPWRSGDQLADGLARVTPAVVFGAQVGPGRLLVAPRTGLELLPAVPGGDLAELFGRLHPGRLQALADALRLDGAGLRSVRALLAVQREAWEQGLLLLRALDADGQSIDERGIDPSTSRIIPNPGALPPEWSGAGPLAASVKPVVTAWFQVFAAALQHEDQDVALVLFAADDLPEEAVQVEIGLREAFHVGFTNAWFTNWALLVVDGVTEGESRRFDFDVSDRQNEIEVVNGALGADQAARALLRPDATYTVDLAYDVLVTGTDEHGNPREGEAKPFPGQQQRFRFRTDARPPERLDPWVLATDPGPAEAFFFYRDPLRVVFATNATRKLFAAYNRKLFAVVKAASGRHPSAGPGFDPARVGLGESLVDPVSVAAFALTPFERALGEAVAELDCIDAGGQTERHERVTLQLRLEPQTDYLLDLEAEPPTGDPTRPMFRLRFSTSRYASMRELAADVARASIQQRRVADATPLAALAAGDPGSLVLQVSDLAFEHALRALGWGDLLRPASPRVTVIRLDDAAGTPLPSSGPVAVMLEVPESLWRSRAAPEEVTDGHGTRRFQLRPQARLEVVETTTGARLVRRFVHSTGGDRTLAILQPAVLRSGGTLSLALRRTHHPLFEGGAVPVPAQAPLVTITLDPRAPWEQQP